VSRAPALCVAALLLAACDSANISLGDGRGDPLSPRDAGETPSEGAAPGFGVPVLVQGLVPGDAGESTDDDPSLTSDLLEMFFDSRREGGAGREDVYETTRASSAEPWRAPGFVAALSSPSRETGIALTGDGLTLYFSSDREGGQGGLDVYVSRRSSRASGAEGWSVPSPVPELSSEGDDLVSAVDPAGETLYLARRDGEDDDYDLYVSALEGGVFVAPAALAELNTDGEESDAFPARGGLALVFTRSEDLVLSERAAAGDPFGAPRPIDALNSDGDDRDAWTTPDLDYVVFSSDRSGEYRLYEARR
jgi:hypothetical protein